MNQEEQQSKMNHPTAFGKETVQLELLIDDKLASFPLSNIVYDQDEFDNKYNEYYRKYKTGNTSITRLVAMYRHVRKMMR